MKADPQEAKSCVSPEDASIESLEALAAKLQPSEKSAAPEITAIPIYQPVTASTLIDSLPEFPRLWTRMLLDAEHGAFVPPFLQEHDFGVLINAGDLFIRRELTPGEEICVSLARGRVLELGAGFGRVSRILLERNMEVIATDADPDVVAMYRARGWSEATEVTLPDIPLSLGKFDTIIALRGVLGLAGELDQVLHGLQRIRELLNPGGRLIFTSSKVNNLLPLPGRSPLEYRYRMIYRGCRSPWQRVTALPEWLSVPFLRALGFTGIQTLDPSTSEGAGYYALASFG